MTPKKTKKGSPKKAKYACYDCGTEVVMDCCGKEMKKK
jgi:hypothetical protein